MIFVLAVSTGYSGYSLQKERSEVHMPIQADEALSIIESHVEAAAFISENLANESGRITRVNLKWTPETDQLCMGHRVDGAGLRLQGWGYGRAQHTQSLG